MVWNHGFDKLHFIDEYLCTLDGKDYSNETTFLLFHMWFLIFNLAANNIGKPTAPALFFAT
jgi:hypothetical protein